MKYKFGSGVDDQDGEIIYATIKTKRCEVTVRQWSPEWMADYEYGDCYPFKRLFVAFGEDTTTAEEKGIDYENTFEGIYAEKILLMFRTDGDKSHVDADYLTIEPSRDVTEAELNQLIETIKAFEKEYEVKLKNLHSERVAWVYDDYKDLSDTEKKQFKKLLKGA